MEALFEGLLEVVIEIFGEFFFEAIFPRLSRYPFFKHSKFTFKRDGLLRFACYLPAIFAFLVMLSPIGCLLLPFMRPALFGCCAAAIFSFLLIIALFIVNLILDRK